MKHVGIFEAKTRLSEICEEVASTQEPVTVTRRGKPLVRIDPLVRETMTIRERRSTYMAAYGDAEEADVADFEVPRRSMDVSEFSVED